MRFTCLLIVLLFFGTAEAAEKRRQYGPVRGALYKVDLPLALADSATPEIRLVVRLRTDPELEPKTWDKAFKAVCWAHHVRLNEIMAAAGADTSNVRITFDWKLGNAEGVTVTGQRRQRRELTYCQKLE